MPREKGVDPVAVAAVDLVMPPSAEEVEDDHIGDEVGKRAGTMPATDVCELNATRATRVV